MAQSLLDDSITLSVTTLTKWMFWGPPSIFGYTILQGIFTVLAIKEVVSVTRAAVMGSSKSLRVNRSILVSMVDDWEDLTKVLYQLTCPRALHSENRSVPRLNRIGWTRFLISAMIALWLFSVDIMLVVLSVPNRSPQDAKFMSKIMWANTGKIPVLTREKVLQGSFSKVINLESENNDVEFTRLPSVSLERTDFRDFGVPIPEFDGRLFVCNNTELWRIVCRVHCENRLFQYKLRMDVTTEGNDSIFFVPTQQFSVAQGPNNVSDYSKAIETQLNINISGTRISTGYFEINASTKPAEYTVLKNGDRVLTHDAVATMFLRSITIFSAPLNVTYYERQAGRRHEDAGQYPCGLIAISQRPYLPLFGTIAFYVFVQVISVLQQHVWGMRGNARDLATLFEVAGADMAENPANIVVRDVSLVEGRHEGGTDVSNESLQYGEGKIVVMNGEDGSDGWSEELQSEESYCDFHGG